MPRQREDLTGIRFGRLTVLEFDHVGPGKQSYWLCECDCCKDNRIVVAAGNLKSGHTQSCGCYKRDRSREAHTIHGGYGSRLYNIWGHIIQRCENEQNSWYSRYGKRGISLCDEWHSFENFYNWAIDNGYEPRLTIDRKNNDDGYYPDNCRWVDRVIQQNNRGNNRHFIYNGIDHTVAEWSRLIGIDYEKLRRHIDRGDARYFEDYFGNATEDD